jgi:hypothetical protein
MNLRRIRWRALLRAMGVKPKIIRFLAQARNIDPRICSCWACRYQGPGQFRHHLMSYCHDNGYMTPTMQKLLGYEPEAQHD